MNIIRKLKTFLHNPWIFGQKMVFWTRWLWSDEVYLRLYYFFCMKKFLHLKNPETYNEKLQWLKLYDRNPMYSTLVDKYEVKKIVAERIGRKHVATLLAHWDTPEELSFEGLPKSFVLKTTHGGGNRGVIIVRDKTAVNIEEIRKDLKKAMQCDLFKLSKEWPYKNIKRRIIAEEFLEDKETGELRDYKFFCFDGVVKALFVATERQKRKEPFFCFFDENYRPIDVKQGHPRPEILPKKPEMFDQMKSIAENLSKGLNHVRVDLYQVNGEIYFGEFTFYHFGGTVPFEPEMWDYVFGSWLKLK